jgi:hypothetical protein
MRHGKRPMPTRWRRMRQPALRVAEEVAVVAETQHQLP